MDLWAPNLRPGFDFKRLELSQEEAFVLCQLDGATTVRNLVHLTGLSKDRLRQILLKLHLAGALAAEGVPDDITREARLVTEGLIETDEPFVIEGLEPAPEIELGNENEGGFGEKLVTDEQLAAEEMALLREEEAVGRDELWLQPTGERPALGGLDELVEPDEPDETEPRFRELAAEELDKVAGPAAPAEPAEPDQPAPAAARPPAEDIPEDPDDVRKLRLARLRKHYKEELSSLPPARRLVLARKAEGDELAAMCADPSPEIHKAVLANPNASVSHARLLASWARHPPLLDLLAAHPRFGRDAWVRRYLLGNMRGSDALYRRLFEQLELGEVVELALGEEISDRAKRAGLAVLRKLYQTAPPEQRLALVLHTDGACLHPPFALNLDTKTAALLVGADLSAGGLIQNLARCRSTPTNVIRHLSTLPPVRSSPALRRLLQQHPNARR